MLSNMTFLDNFLINNFYGTTHIHRIFVTQHFQKHTLCVIHNLIFIISLCLTVLAK
jgi:hypothetical protein